MNAARERLKSVLTSLDEGDFERASLELKLLSDLPIDRSVKMFLSGLVFLLNRERKKARESFDELLSLFGQNKMEAKKEIEILLMSLHVLASDKAMKAIVDKSKPFEVVNGIDLGKFLAEAAALVPKEAQELLISSQIILECERVALGQKSLEDALGSNLLQQVELAHSGLVTASALDKLGESEGGWAFISCVGNSQLVRRIAYDRYLELFERLFQSAEDERRKDLIKHLATVLHRIEPRKGNLAYNPMLYIKLKPIYNQLGLRFYFDSGAEQDGYRWLEGYGLNQGLDFLRIQTEIVEPLAKDGARTSGLIRELLGPYERSYFEVAEDGHPCAFRINGDTIDFHPVFDEASSEPDVVATKQHIVASYASMEYYLSSYGHYASLRQNEISQRIFQKIEGRITEFVQWTYQNSEYIVQVFFPIELAALFEERQQYDDAIFLLRQTFGPEEERKKILERCYYKRDGFIYEGLKSALRGLNELEQKQLLGYASLFKLELRLRDVVDKTMTERCNTPKWLEDERSSELQDTKKECLKRKDDFTNYPYYKVEVRDHRLVDFATMPELRSIIDVHWQHFKSTFGNKDGFMSLLGPISRIRLDIAHARLIDKKQLQTLVDHCSELYKVLDVSDGAANISAQRNKLTRKPG